MPQKTLLKFISSFYHERKANPGNSQPLSEFVYENFMNAYGLKNVAEKKYF